MTSAGKLQKGDTISFYDGSKAIVLAVGRSSVINSVFVYKDNGTTKLIPEIEYWLGKNIHYVTRKKSNVRWAKEYVAAHPGEIPDL